MALGADGGVRPRLGDDEVRGLGRVYITLGACSKSECCVTSSEPRR